MMKPFIPLIAVLSLAACSNITTIDQPSQTTAMPTQPTPSPKTVTLISKHNFEDTVNRLATAIKGRGMTVFATIDHTSAAQEQGLQMQPATVLIFGNPKAGTPLMIKDPAFALQLPLKVLITETQGQVQVVYTPATTLIEGSQITPNDVANTLANAEKLIQATVE